MTLILWSIFGAVSLAICNSFFKANPLNLPWVLLLIVMIPLTTFGTQLGFMMAYKTGEPFFKCWFVGTACTATTGWLASRLIFGEPMQILHGLGIILIGGGTWLLIK